MPKNSKGKDVAEIIQSKCIADQLCIGECPVGAIDMKDGKVVVDGETCVGCGKCFDICPVGAILFEKPRKKKKITGVPEVRKVDGYRGVAVFIEVREGKGAEVSWELLGKARELAEVLDTQVIGFLVGSDVEPVAKEAIAYGCDKVWVMDHPVLGVYITKAYGKALVQLCQQVKPEILMVGATPLGRDLAGVVATILETGLTADCTGLAIDPQERLLMMTRPTFGGNIMATIACRDHRPQMCTVRPRVMKMPKRDEGRQGEISQATFEISGDTLPKILNFIPKGVGVGGVDITRSPVLVVVGRGACDARHLPMFEELAQLLGGTVACSRPVVESGLMPYIRQVGQTGRTVTPRIYIAIGVSGAIQHLVAMQGSEKILAINSDRHAPLVQISDYALIGNYAEIVPKLIEGIKGKILPEGRRNE